MQTALLRGQQSAQRSSSFDESANQPRGSSVTSHQDMNKFSCWKVVMFVAGAILSIVGGIIAAGGFAFGGVGVLVTAPIGACIHAVGDSLMMASGVMLYIDSKERQRAEREEYNRAGYQAARHPIGYGGNYNTLSGMGAKTRTRSTQTDTAVFNYDVHNPDISSPISAHPQGIGEMSGNNRYRSNSSSNSNFEIRGQQMGGDVDTPRPIYDPQSPDIIRTDPISFTPHAPRRPAPPPAPPQQPSTSATTKGATQALQRPILMSKRNPADPKSADKVYICD